MSTDPRIREQALVRQLRSRFEGEGYQFVEYPTRDLLPSFLGSYRPDAIAIGADRNVAIEVKTRTAPDGEPLARISRLFEGHPDWEFRVVVAEQSDTGGYLAPPSRDDLTRALREARTLAEQGHLRPALVMGWSAVEGYARSLEPERFEGRAGPQQTIQWLVAKGELSQEAGHALRALIPKRNAAVHGDYSTVVSPTEVRTLLERLENLLDAQPHEGAAAF